MDKSKRTGQFAFRSPLYPGAYHSQHVQSVSAVSACSQCQCVQVGRTLNNVETKFLEFAMSRGINKRNGEFAFSSPLYPGAPDARRFKPSKSSCIHSMQ